MNPAEGGHPIQIDDLVPPIVARLPIILAEVRELLAEQCPDYAGFLTEDFAEVLAASEGFIARLVGLAKRDPSTIAPQLASGVERALFEEIGRIHYEQQQDVAHLLAAYRTGAAVAWRHVSDTALQLGVPVETIAGLAAVIFAAVEQLSSSSLRGYERAQTTAEHAHEQLRHELAELLLSDRCDMAALRIAAARAKWTLPRHAAVVLINPDNEVGRVLLDRLDDSCLQLRRPQMLVTIVPDPEGPGRRKRLSATLKSWLMNMGNRKAVADELHVHPQTVRYRLDRLRELFGPALDDPATRAALLLALAWGPAVTEADPLAQHRQPQ